MNIHQDRLVPMEMIQVALGISAMQKDDCVG